MGSSSGRCARLGDDELAVGVGDVAQQVLAAAGVVEADDGGAGEGGAAEGEEVLGHVVEQDGDMRRPVRVERGRGTGRAHRARLGEELGVGPDAVAGADRRRGRRCRGRCRCGAGGRRRSAAGSVGLAGRGRSADWPSRGET